MYWKIKIPVGALIGILSFSEQHGYRAYLMKCLPIPTPRSQW